MNNINKWIRPLSWRQTVLAAIFVALLEATSTEGCSCALSHPQTHFCTSDYVILAKIKDTRKDHRDGLISYSIKMRKIFKVTDKAAVWLEHNRIYSADNDGLCGVSLNNDTRYLLAGRIVNGKPYISLCNYHGDWDLLSQKQKKGFRLLYKQGCECKISSCPWWRHGACPTNMNTCQWDTMGDGDYDCQATHGVCVRQMHGKCSWNTNRQYRTCMKQRKEQKEIERLREP